MSDFRHNSVSPAQVQGTPLILEFNRVFGRNPNDWAKAVWYSGVERKGGGGAIDVNALLGLFFFFFFFFFGSFLFLFPHCFVACRFLILRAV